MDDAPGFQDIQDWIQTDPLTLDDFEEQAVLLLFWRYASATCQRALQPVTRLWEEYGDDGFTVIGVHTPAFDFERDPANVRDAVDRLDVPFPVAIDNENTTWKLYGGRYWPRYALIDQDGRIREEHVGDGGYGQLEERIRRLIRWNGGELADPVFEDEPFPPEENEQFVSPDIYAGDKWGKDLGNIDFHPCSPYARVTYHDERPEEHEMNRLYLNGEWIREADHLAFTGNDETDAYAALRFSGKDCYAVMAADEETTVTVTLDGEPVPPAASGPALDERDGETVVQVSRPDTYQLLARDGVDIGEITLRPDTPFRLYAFTFR